MVFSFYVFDATRPLFKEPSLNAFARQSKHREYTFYRADFS